jgi:hypothetical protein
MASPDKAGGAANAKVAPPKAPRPAAAPTTPVKLPRFTNPHGPRGGA